MEWRSAKLLNSRETKNFTERSAFTCLSVKQAVPNQILIFQPSFKLKYRDVTYHTKEILCVNINNAKIEPGLVKLNSLEQPLNSNKINSPEISGSS
ncbi:MAG: hypothetical protein WBM44_07155 [Waterburya sp.]